MKAFVGFCRIYEAPMKNVKTFCFTVFTFFLVFTADTIKLELFFEIRSKAKK